MSPHDWHFHKICMASNYAGNQNFLRCSNYLTPLAHLLCQPLTRTVPTFYLTEWLHFTASGCSLMQLIDNSVNISKYTCKWSSRGLLSLIFDPPAGVSSAGLASACVLWYSGTAAAAERNRWWMMCQNGQCCLPRRLYQQARILSLTFSALRAEVVAGHADHGHDAWRTEPVLLIYQCHVFRAVETLHETYV